MFETFLQAPRPVKTLVFVLGATGKGATYSALAWVLGYSNDMDLRRILRKAEALNLIKRVPTGVGRGAKTVIVLTDEAKQIILQMRGAK